MVFDGAFDGDLAPGLWPLSPGQAQPEAETWVRPPVHDPQKEPQVPGFCESSGSPNKQA